MSRGQTPNMIAVLALTGVVVGFLLGAILVVVQLESVVTQLSLIRVELRQARITGDRGVAVLRQIRNEEMRGADVP